MTVIVDGIPIDWSSVEVMSDGNRAHAVYVDGERVWPTAAVVTVTIHPVSEDLLDFPVYIDLGDMPTEFWSTVTVSGGDIRCSTGGSEIPREVGVVFDRLSQIGQLYVKCDLSSTVDTVVTITVDGSSADYAATDPFGSQAVWSNSYVSVYHMDTDPAVDLPDSASGYNATPVDSTPTLTYGIMGTATLFDGTGHLSASTSGIVTGAGTRTMSAWVYANVGAGNLVFWGQGSLGLGNLFELMRWNGRFIVHAYGGGYDTISVNIPLADETAMYCVATYDGINVKMYADGVYCGSVAMSLDTGTDFNNLGGPGYFDRWSGIVDEARLSNAVRSDAWIAAEYINQSSPTTFYTVTSGL